MATEARLEVATRRVMSYGDFLADDGVNPNVGLTAAQLATINANFGSPANGGLVLNSDGTITLLPAPTPPAPPATTIAAAAGLGTGPPTPAVSAAIPGTSSDLRGAVSLGSGSAPAADATGFFPLVTITFGTALPFPPHGAVIDATGAATIPLGVLRAADMSTAGFTIYSEKAPAAGLAAGSIVITYALS